ncbi:MAG: transcription elongation factor GreB [Methylomonas sp.]|nr:transcription elongation factor GreB [Methylomonas sp.]PPD21114.1 MAG: transcription elongation factor GreB [Methylomonas sp.]PPD27547.1 MAG: transcription elongation factor GreB [Methylomonas sp.]PPD39543.1 MAG: transcription elongation factor GreB [Methylomonas sp.]PPD55794.1 MAG: transcription elongation factor GreB [Methylomonas sp.]
MSRWKPPRPPSSPYITADGYKTLESELKQLWLRRADVTAALSAAAAEGDRSENAEYIYRKKELREIDRRIHYLQKRLPTLTVVTEKPGNQDQVYFGAWVTLETASGDEITYRIVGADEIDTSGGLISLDSPLARVLLKKTVDDEVVIHRDGQQSCYLVVDIRY